MNKLFVLLKKDLLGLWRTKKILILGLVFLLFALSSPVLAYYTPDIVKMASPNLVLNIPKATIFDSYHQFSGNLSQIGLFVLIILSASEIVTERQKGQFTSLLNNGVNKAQFVLAKILSQVVVFSLIFLFAIGFFGIYNFVLFNRAFAGHSVLSFALLYVYFLFVLTLCNFFSSFSKSLAITMVFSFAVTVLMSIFNIFKFGKYLPSALPGLFESVLKSERLTNAYQTMGITVLVTVVLLGLAIRFCRNKD